MEFSRELRSDVLAGAITLSVRLWKRPRVKEGGRYPVGLFEIEVDSIELVTFAADKQANPIARRCASGPRTRGE